jgi:hypothetical protein
VVGIAATGTGDRRSWPTAPTTTRVSPGKSTADTGCSRSRGSVSTPTPATVWTAGTAPIDLDTTWPAALVERIVTSFGEPAAGVVLVAWPTPNHTCPTPNAAGATASSTTRPEPSRTPS